MTILELTNWYNLYDKWNCNRNEGYMNNNTFAVVRMTNYRHNGSLLTERSPIVVRNKLSVECKVKHFICKEDGDFLIEQMSVC